MKVHVFISTVPLRSQAHLDEIVQKTFTDDGESVDSVFTAEVGLDAWEPACIESIVAERETPLHVLLEGASYGSTWLASLPRGLTAYAAVCVFPPNVLTHPERSSRLRYVGAFDFTT